jgi:hypothetical protein
MTDNKVRNSDHEGNLPGVILTFLLSLAIFFWRVIVFAEPTIAGDALYYSYPLRTYAWKILKAGALPLWTPAIMGGYPLLAMSSLALAYPLTWGYAFLPGYWAEQLYVAAPFLLTPTFTYMYVREIGRSHYAALLAALSFGYSGFSLATVNGYLTNGVMWLPLLLLVLERSPRTSTVKSVLLICLVYTLSILNGLAQAFVYVGVITALYALVLGFWTQNERRARFRPLLIVIVGMLLAMGLSAFQTLETWQAIKLSVRQGLTYDTFTEGSYTLYSAVKSFIAPRFNMIDMPIYVPPISLLMALAGVTINFVFRTERKLDPRILFWAVLAVIASVLLLGNNTPLYRILYYIPFLNLFRVPARHGIEWSFAVAVLSAYGWDSLKAITFKSRSRTKSREILLLLATIVLGVVGCYWISLAWRFGNEDWERAYVLAKLVFTVIAVIATVFYFNSEPARHIKMSGWAILCLACLVESFIVFQPLWYPVQGRGQRFFLEPAPATTFLQQFRNDQARVFTDGPDIPQRFDSYNRVALFGLENVGGYEPAMLTRFSVALGNVGPDTGQLRRGLHSNSNLFDPRSHVLDLLGAKYVTTFFDPGTYLDQTVTKDGVVFEATAASLKLRPGESIFLFPGEPVDGDTVAVVSTLGYSGNIRDNEPVASLELQSNAGDVEKTLLAGRDTAEWAHERSDVKRRIQHRQAAIFDSAPGDESQSFTGYRYLATIPLDAYRKWQGVKITNTSGAHLSIWKLTIYDSKTHSSHPLPLMPLDCWNPIFNRNQVMVLENRRAMPRAWLTDEVRVVSNQEALLSIQGNLPFDPRTTALVEEPVPNYTGNGEPFSGQPSAMVQSYGPTHIVVETASAKSSMLVVSDVYYPGWVATVDGQTAPLYQTDYLLRGLPVTAGKHRVEMRYTAPAARNGLALSLISALLIVSIVVYGSRIDRRLNG